MNTDAELLREFVNRNAESAFSELVQRHIGVVYSAACRETHGDLSAAQDITQLVFIELARKACSLLNHPTLAGWLYTCVRFISANLRRGDHRRTMREEEASAMNELLRPGLDEPTWREIRPVIDDALHELGADDRDAVLLRFFEGRSLREVGNALSLTENAARMRVERALEKLRIALGKRGVNSTGSALSAALVVGMVTVPPDVISAVTSSALSAANVSTAAASTWLGVAATKSALVGLTALVVAGVGLGVWQQQRNSRLANANADLRGQLAEFNQMRADNRRLAAELGALRESSERDRLESLRLRALAAGTSNSAVEKRAQVPYVKPKERWRERFEAVYKMPGGEVLRHINPPFIPERAEYSRREFRNDERKPVYLLIRQDRRGLNKPDAGFEKNATLDDLLRGALGLKRYEIYGPDELLALMIPGDWVVRPASALEFRIATLETIIQTATGRSICIEKRQADNDTLVVRGTFDLKSAKKLDVFAEKRNVEWAKSSHGDFKAFLNAVGDHLNVPFVSEVQVQGEGAVAWYCHADANYWHAGERRLELLNKVLENLRRQTSLSFELERRPGTVWVLKEK